MLKRDRRHFIVKHGLDAFEALPRFIWRTCERQKPKAFEYVSRGDRWIGFAYTTSDNRERPLSLVTGFFECVTEALYRRIPRAGLPISDGETMAWMIEGRACGKQPREPMGVPPIDDLLSRRHFKQGTLVPISEAEFQRVQEKALARQFDTRKIPLLGREPRCEAGSTTTRRFVRACIACTSFNP
jgi:hypothetical protein